MIRFINTRKRSWIISSVIVLIAFFYAKSGSAQLGINASNDPADASAIVDVASTTKGFLPPRMTTDQRKAIASPVEGLVVYNTDTQTIEVFNGDVWTTNTGQFKCGTTQMKGKSGNRYETILIGSQCWMAENLNTGNRIDGSEDMADNWNIEKYCYDNSEAYCEEYGALYQWDEMMNYISWEGAQGICPDEWHIPSHSEWEELVLFLGDSLVAGGKLKEAGTLHWGDQNAGTNSSGFTALGSGYVYTNHAFYDLKGSCNIWTSTEESIGNEAIYYAMYEETIYTYTNYDFKAFACSVRCIKN